MKHTIFSIPKLGLIIPLIGLLTGCMGGAYNENYTAYLAGCQQAQNQKSITLPIQGGQTLTINQGCSLQPPMDTQTPLLSALISGGTNIVGHAINSFASIKSSRYSNQTLQQAFENAGPSIGRDGFVGTGPGFTVDETAPPPEPIVVLPPAPPPLP